MSTWPISRESSTNEWAHVVKAKTLAIRVQEQDVVGSIDGQRTLTIRTGGQTNTFTFTLYLVPGTHTVIATTHGVESPYRRGTASSAPTAAPERSAAYIRPIFFPRARNNDMHMEEPSVTIGTRMIATQRARRSSIHIGDLSLFVDPPARDSIVVIGTTQPALSRERRICR